MKLLIALTSDEALQHRIITIIIVKEMWVYVEKDWEVQVRVCD